VAGGVVAEACPVAADFRAAVTGKGGSAGREHEGETDRDREKAAPHLERVYVGESANATSSR